MVRLSNYALHSSQETSGRIRHPRELDGPLDELSPGEPRQRYLFARCHHQTLVAAMAAFLGPGRQGLPGPLTP